MELTKASVKQRPTITYEVNKESGHLVVMATAEVENLYLMSVPVRIPLRDLAEDYYRNNPHFPEYMKSTTLDSQ